MVVCLNDVTHDTAGKPTVISTDTRPSDGVVDAVGVCELLPVPVSVAVADDEDVLVGVARSDGDASSDPGSAIVALGDPESVLERVEDSDSGGAPVSVAVAVAVALAAEERDA